MEAIAHKFCLSQLSGIRAVSAGTGNGRLVIFQPHSGHIDGSRPVTNHDGQWSRHSSGLVAAGSLPYQVSQLSQIHRASLVWVCVLNIAVPFLPLSA
jgi:hypothetical protein